MMNICFGSPVRALITFVAIAFAFGQLAGVSEGSILYDMIIALSQILQPFLVYGAVAVGLVIILKWVGHCLWEATPKWAKPAPAQTQGKKKKKADDEDEDNDD